MSIAEPARDDSCRSRGHERSVDRGEVDPIIFDFDGVLVDTAEDIATAANAVLQHYGRPAASLERVRSYIGGGAESLLRELLLHVDEGLPSEALAMFKMNYSQCYDVHTQLYPGVRNALDGLLAAGKHMAIATNKIESITQALIRRFGLEPYFLVVVGPESVTHRKPDPEAIDLILSRLELHPGRTLMVGDKAADILAGKAAGTMTCGALYGYGTQPEITSAGPDFVIRTIEELPRALNTFESHRR